ncbi:TspO/MBR family protein [Chloroflexota bacterium]
MDGSTIVKLIICIVACFAAAGFGGIFTSKAIPDWYRGLKKPRYTPPNWVFGPVWTILYILMAISVFLVWQQGLSAPGVSIAFTLFWIQLTANALWSYVFFARRSIIGGIINIIILWLLILATIITSFPVSTIAGILLVPYILWVSIATYLNIGIWMLNSVSKERN